MIKDVLISPLKQYVDERGSVLQMLRNDAPEFESFGECYFSEVVPGAIKAWKRHRVQTQNLAVPVGRVRLVIYDDREFSSTRGQLQVLELGRPDAYQRLRIAAGLWYGFTCISTKPALLANCTDLPHDPADAEGLKWDDPSIPYSWGAGKSVGFKL